MRHEHDRDQLTGLQRPPPFRRWLAVPIVAGFLAVAGLSLAACGSSNSTTAAMLNTKKIEQAIAESSLAQRGQHAQVTCPSEVLQIKGLEFSCVARVGETSTRFVVVQRDGDGHVHYEAP